MNVKEKILQLDQLAQVLEGRRKAGEKIVHCHGVFDLLHIGHIRHFEQARRLGNVLVVTITEDRYVNKGPDRPAFAQQLRSEAIAALSFVDFVATNRWPTATETIRLLKPNFYVKGSDYRNRSEDLTGKISEEELAVQEVGGEMVFTDDIVFSSTSLINAHFGGLSTEQSEYLKIFKDKHDIREVIAWIERTQSLRVLVVGETIIDDYHYCEAIGKAGKEPVLVTRHISSEQFAGGVLAVANHVASFAKEVGLLSFLGEQDSKLEFIADRLKPNVCPHFLYTRNGTTIVKRRFVENYLLQKLFEVYFLDPDAFQSHEADALEAKLVELVPEYDMLIVADYGHGMLTSRAIQTMSQAARFMAVNTQSNAGNNGYHTISLYPRADYVCLASHELAMDLRSRKGNLEGMIQDVAGRLKCHQVSVTMGKYGMTTFDKEKGFAKCPAFTQDVTDRIGSGDAVLSITSLLSALGAPPDILAFLGNVAGSEAVKIVGHRSFIERVPFLKHVQRLLK
jgi:rfaE bifunctional protein kinase chain/domain/rfaE bifunctional protein nucleotidyltransferase chain/domain